VWCAVVGFPTPTVFRLGYCPLPLQIDALRMTSVLIP